MITTQMDPEKARWVGTGIPLRLRGLTLNDVEEMSGDTSSIKKARIYVEGYRAQQSKNWRGLPTSNAFGRGLLFAGHPGTGKTTLAAAVLCELRRRWGVSVYASRYSEHIERERSLLRADQSVDPERVSRWQYAVERVQWADVVLLDDVGHEHSTDSKFAEDTLEKLLRQRYDEGRPTLITTNLSGDDWAARYSKALRSFMDQCTRREIFTGESYRRGDQ
ncbi:ATP-binding protein [Actinacidiphila sp. ITFR-21]|uniref:ATP-binding protein n=1 Tax=Actinacidiphila sp. ITFR-21 TaxID=3075199 RepID=UPI00288B920E|nr:ATP-binding protein [Streptomyces sp. ITFR-21]WNI17603.1 ATP-binding protein [Streptomyces sp. ITFR-21]WNI17743.1 ATP-binding protein [Streptomyces sp. ITFR-21]